MVARVIHLDAYRTRAARTGDAAAVADVLLARYRELENWPRAFREAARGRVLKDLRAGGEFAEVAAWRFERFHLADATDRARFIAAHLRTQGRAIRGCAALLREARRAGRPARTIRYRMNELRKAKDRLLVSLHEVGWRRIDRDAMREAGRQAHAGNLEAARQTLRDCTARLQRRDRQLERGVYASGAKKGQLFTDEHRAGLVRGRAVMVRAMREAQQRIEALEAVSDPLLALGVGERLRGSR